MMTVRKNEVVVVFVLTGFGDARTSSEILGLELRPELKPRAFLFGVSPEQCTRDLNRMIHWFCRRSELLLTLRLALSRE